MNGIGLAGRAGELRGCRTPFVLATVVRAERPTSAKPGDQALVLPDGTVEGFVGGVCAESTMRLEGLRMLQRGESVLLRITPGGGGDAAPEPGLRTVENHCLSGGSLEIFLESVLPAPLVAVLGDAPVAHALRRVGEALDYDVRPIIDPVAALPADTAAVVVASHGRDEARVLTAALRSGVPYIALVASRRRAAAVLGGLDVEEEQRRQVHAPAGLDIGARTPGEIALSIFAQFAAARLVSEKSRSGGTAHPRAPEAP
ncbi:XdhC family protein [Pseudonocardia asaccharolytica]|uniref:Carbon monoxide dehydrogenase F protein n=1 Tax=Pseudonocardia asaccharolytica DSM 44247 = NBRC 16224 TaxID=1123024 RepID=A0A511D9J3_9PSEU|nr:XdhC family protein [Pseudonocardia asaccharolytica]GEL19618.1 carbon monoxide dehydrogenase F protein [Pseudonocardia asaccharolytica DSM 44247 = NBRC 16224]